MTFKTILYVACCFIITTNLLIAKNTREIIEEIPLEDRKILEELFSILIIDDVFGYTLFGDKPVTIGSHFNSTPWENILELGQHDELFWKKWMIWEKYQNKFHMKNYLFFKEVNSIVNEIIIINKHEFIKTINRNIQLFENILKKKINPFQLFEDINIGKYSFYDSIENHEMLLGILLGYGKHNALLLCQRGKIFKLDCLSSFAEYERGSLIRLGSFSFMVDDKHPETKYLKNNYASLRGKISAIYANGNFLEITLTQLTSDKERLTH